MGDEQNTLFDWFRARRSPRGAVSRDGVASRDASDDAIRALHGRLERALGTVDLVITDNRRRMVTARRRGRRHELRLHHMFLGADDDVVAALVDLSRGKKSPRDRLRRFVREHSDRIRHEVDPEQLDTNGEHHHLEQALERALDLVDDPETHQDIAITWGRYGRGSRSIRFGSFDGNQRLIRVHPALDADWVPRYFIDFVVYHELLHAVIPPRQGDGGRRILHPPEFRELEARFPEYEKAMAWERENLERLLNR